MTVAARERTADLRIYVRREEVPLDAEKLCGARFVPADPPFPRHVAVYRINRPWGDPLDCAQDERDRWAEAERAFLDAVSAALEELYRAHGGRGTQVDLHAGSGVWSHLPAPLPLPGRRRRLAARSAAAQRAFLERLEQAERAYRPVRKEIEWRIEEHQAAQRAAERARRQAEQRRREVFLEVAGQRVWSYAVVTVKRRSAVLAYRLDVAPARPLPEPVEPPARPLDAAGLEAALLEALRDGGHSRVRWDPQARAAVERECQERGEEATFEQWWQAVSGEHWRPGPRPPVHGGSHHSSHGAGDGGYGGGDGGYSGCGGGF
ncbi:hypothetical protein [Streptomyces sp. enrichment culture]|uniref:hypothetical protein n=1 Tax=Streptomyces sp. enrichment culture TaxID=1795815 RepID=UPI003F5431FB